VSVRLLARPPRHAQLRPLEHLAAKITVDGAGCIYLDDSDSATLSFVGTHWVDESGVSWPAAEIRSDLSLEIAGDSETFSLPPILSLSGEGSGTPILAG
jgi:hypothetical protein